MDTQVLQPTKTADNDGPLTPAEYAAYQARKGKEFQLDEFTFKAHPNLTPGEQTDLWRDDSAILKELLYAVLKHAPQFAAWIRDGVPGIPIEED